MKRRVTAAQTRAAQKVPPKVPVIVPDATERLFSYVERDLLPVRIEQILASALQGDLTQQGYLFELMVDTWPRLSKNMSEVRRAVGKAPWSVQPFAEKGKDPTPQAQEIAEYIEKAIWSMTPRPTYQEDGFEGLVGWLATAAFGGTRVLEVYWHSTIDGILPRAARTVSAQYLGYPCHRGEEDRLMLKPSGYYNGQLEDFPEHHFLIGNYRAHTGHASVAAPMRSLVGWWVAQRYGLKWFMQFSQIYGIPLRWATYRDETLIGEIEAMLSNIGTSGWGAFPEGTSLQIQEANRAATSLPQGALLDRADTQADILILGQTLTSDVGDSGSRALGDVHEGVRMEVLCGCADMAAAVINHQLIPSIIALNFGEVDGLPWLDPGIEEPEDEMAMANRDKILFTDMGLPVASSWLYERHGVPMPAPEDELFKPPAKPQPAGMGGDETEDPEPMPEDAEAVEAARAETRKRQKELDRLVDMVLGGLTDVKLQWLSGVRPYFEALIRAARSGEVTDKQFLNTVTAARRQMPELFNKLDTETLKTALEESISAGLLSGTVGRIDV
jgi:phage gp29-like protein